jgi:hypothetical protein
MQFSNIMVDRSEALEIQLGKVFGGSGPLNDVRLGGMRFGKLMAKVAASFEELKGHHANEIASLKKGFQKELDVLSVDRFKAQGSKSDQVAKFRQEGCTTSLLDLAAGPLEITTSMFASFRDEDAAMTRTSLCVDPPTLESGRSAEQLSAQETFRLGTAARSASHVCHLVSLQGDRRSSFFCVKTLQVLNLLVVCLLERRSGPVVLGSKF